MRTPTDTSKEISRHDLSKITLFGTGTLLVVEQMSRESQSKGCAKTPILPVFGLVVNGQPKITILNVFTHDYNAVDLALVYIHLLDIAI